MKLFTTVCMHTLFITFAITSCKSSIEPQFAKIKGFSKNQEVRLAVAYQPTSLDPRKSEGLASANITRMLFEGLTYINENGKIFPGCAKDIKISADLKTYTFTLRDALWTNGDKVVASDFVYSWLSTLNPQMKAPCAYLLFDIKNAKNFYEGKAIQDEVGIRAVDDKTLVVTLQSPHPYFLQLTSTPAFLPVHQKWAEAHPDFKEGKTMFCVCNGPYGVASFVPQQKLELLKNKRYWDAATVKVSKAHISFMDDQEALNAFQRGEVDWVGAPLSTLGATGQKSFTEIESTANNANQDVQKLSSTLHFSPAAGTQFLRLNVAKAPFNNATFRRALMLATDSQSIVKNIMKGDQKPARGLVPPDMGLQNSGLSHYDADQAARVMEEALVEMSITRNDLSAITLSYVQSERMQKIAEFLAQNWKTVLNIEVELEAMAGTSFYNKLFNQDYQIAAGSWFADYFDPMSFLSVFQTVDNGTNYTGWVNSNYTQLLNQSNLEIDPTARMNILQRAQDVLVQDVPVIPLFHFTFAYSKNDRLQEEVVSPMGMMNADDAYFVDIK